MRAFDSVLFVWPQSHKTRCSPERWIYTVVSYWSLERSGT